MITSYPSRLWLRFAFTLTILFSFAASALAGDRSFESWLSWQQSESKARLFKNISADGAARGSVVASPQRENPNYFYHWTRDAALTMSEVIELYDRAQTIGEKLELKAKLKDYVAFSRSNQQTNALTGLGEPKFNPDGTPFMGGWCRPQNDGPALRAMTLIRFANRLIKAGERSYVNSNLYRAELPAATVIKVDLEFVAHHWREPNCELWEEVEGHHFYNRAMQLKALTEGAKLASKLRDPGAAQFYRQEAKNLRAELAKHWDPKTGAFVPTLIRTGGLSSKSGGLDSSVILAVLHTSYDGTAIYQIDDPRVISSLNVLTSSFRKLYPINGGSGPLENGVLGPAIGRYPEDVYGGDHFECGNPWVLITAAFASAAYKISDRLAVDGKESAANDWFKKGDAFLERVRKHGNPDGSLSEQMERSSGFMVGARDLTWSHAEVLHAISSRKKALKRF